LNTPSPRLPPRAPLGIDSSISPVPLPLVLTRTRPGRSLQDGSADIGVDARSPQTYVGGAILANGSRISEIRADFVVLTNNGRSVRLYVRGDPEAHERVVFEIDLDSVGGEVVPPGSQPDAPAPQLTDFIRPSPVYAGDALRGYQVYPARNAMGFRQLGLMPGDIVTTINGTHLVETESAIALLEQLAHGSVVTATIERQAASKVVTLDGSAMLAVLEQEKLAALADESLLSPQS
jgi:general secretion pathway protein C